MLLVISKLSVQKAYEFVSMLSSRLYDLDNNNHKIIARTTITFLASINMTFGHFEIAKEVWEFLSTRYVSSDLA